MLPGLSGGGLAPRGQRLWWRAAFRGRHQELPQVNAHSPCQSIEEVDAGLEPLIATTVWEAYARPIGPLALRYRDGFYFGYRLMLALRTTGNVILEQ